MQRDDATFDQLCHDANGHDVTFFKISGCEETPPFVLHMLCFDKHQNMLVCNKGHVSLYVPHVPYDMNNILTVGGDKIIFDIKYLQNDAHRSELRFSYNLSKN